MRENKFSIGDTVYHVTPDSGKGVIVEVTYMFSVDKYAYTVATTWNTEYVCS